VSKFLRESMSIRTKLYILIILFGLTLLINLVALGLLARTATTVLNTTDKVLQQQSAALRMQAVLRDAEAALYRYEIEGETGFATYFREQLNQFQNEIGKYEGLIGTPNQQIWVQELRSAHQNAIEFGEKLIAQREQQDIALIAVEELQTEATALLTGPLREIRSDDLNYQRTISGMSISLSEMLFALISYQATPREIDRVRFMDSISTFRLYHKQFTEQISGEQETVQQLVQGQGIIVDEIQPQAANNILQAQSDLDQAVRNSLLLSLATIAISSIIFVSIIMPLLRRMNSSILALLRGADSVAEGDLTDTITVSGQDEFKQRQYAL